MPKRFVFTILILTLICLSTCALADIQEIETILQQSNSSTRIIADGEALVITMDYNKSQQDGDTIPVDEERSKALLTPYKSLVVILIQNDLPVMTLYTPIVDGVPQNDAASTMMSVSFMFSGITTN